MQKGRNKNGTLKKGYRLTPSGKVAKITKAMKKLAAQRERGFIRDLERAGRS